MAATVPEGLSRDGALAAVIAAERHVRWAQAYSYQAMASLVDRMSEEVAGEEAADRAAGNRTPWRISGDDLASAEVAAALHLTRMTADARVGLAGRLADRLPACHAAMSRGELDVSRVTVIDRETGGLDDQEARQVDQAVAREVTTETTTGVRKLVKKAVLAVNPQAAEKRHAKAVRERRIVMNPQPDGMASLYELQPASRALLIWNVSRALVGPKQPGDTRGMGERLADTHYDLYAEIADHLADPTHAGAPGGLLAAIAPRLFDRSAGLADRGGKQGEPAGPTATGDLKADVGPVPADQRAEAGRPETTGGLRPPGDTGGPGKPTGTRGQDPADLELEPGAPEERASSAPGGQAPGAPEERTSSAPRGHEHYRTGGRRQGEADGPHSTRRRRLRSRWAQLQITVSRDTLLGLSQEPGELAGYGPVTASVARQHADVAGIWHRIITDPLGQLLDHPRRSYHPSPALAAHVIARDGTCRWPGCHRPARQCHLDHRQPWPEGPTSSGNLGCLCVFDHHMKHRSGWVVDPARPGEHPATIHWTSRTGRSYTVHPHRYPTGGAGRGGGTADTGRDHGGPLRGETVASTNADPGTAWDDRPQRDTSSGQDEPKSDQDLGPPPF
jgi:hypothetical protein